MNVALDNLVAVCLAVLSVDLPLACGSLNEELQWSSASKASLGLFSMVPYGHWPVHYLVARFFKCLPHPSKDE